MLSVASASVRLSPTVHINIIALLILRSVTVRLFYDSFITESESENESDTRPNPETEKKQKISNNVKTKINARTIERT